MKEHYVSFEQAVKLKELGFDWEVRGYYTSDDNFRKVWEVTALNHNDTKKFKNILSAPRLDQAQAWLRDKGIHILVTPRQECIYKNKCLCNTKHYWNFDLMQIEDEWKPYGSFVEYESYESALSAGISKALELLGKEDKQ